jgi:hypothetical protein
MDHLRRHESNSSHRPRLLLCYSPAVLAHQLLLEQAPGRLLRTGRRHYRLDVPLQRVFSNNRLYFRHIAVLLDLESEYDHEFEDFVDPYPRNGLHVSPPQDLQLSLQLLMQHTQSQYSCSRPLRIHHGL